MEKCQQTWRKGFKGCGHSEAIDQCRNRGRVSCPDGGARGGSLEAGPRGEGAQILVVSSFSIDSQHEHDETGVLGGLFPKTRAVFEVGRRL